MGANGTPRRSDRELRELSAVATRPHPDPGATLIASSDAAYLARRVNLAAARGELDRLEINPASIPRASRVAGCSLAQATLAIEALPDLQAPVWADPHLPARPWLDPARTDMIFAAVAPSVDPFLERFTESLEPEHVERASDGAALG